MSKVAFSFSIAAHKYKLWHVFIYSVYVLFNF